MGDFDEMLKAGVISPGSTPYVEGKRAPATEQEVTTAQVTVTNEVRTSVTTGPHGSLASALVVSDNPSVLFRARSRLQGMCQTVTASDPSLLELGLTFDLILADAALPDLERVLMPGRNVLLLADEADFAGVHTLAASRAVRVLEQPWEDGILATTVGSMLNQQASPSGGKR